MAARLRPGAFSGGGVRQGHNILKGALTKRRGSRDRQGHKSTTLTSKKRRLQRGGGSGSRDRQGHNIDIQKGAFTKGREVAFLGTDRGTTLTSKRGRLQRGGRWRF